MSFCKHRVLDMCKKDNRPCIFSRDCYEPEEEKTITNADRIRAMSDEGLTKLLCCTGWRMIEQKECLEWLQQPAEEDDHA